MIRFKCPGCRVHFTTHDDLKIGTAGTCPKCRSAFVVPSRAAPEPLLEEDAPSPSPAKKKRSVLRYRNPANGYTEKVSNLAWLWVLLFGCFYFAVKGVWRHVVVGFALGLLTVGLSWFVYPFFARSILRTHYLRLGWVRVKKNEPRPIESN